MELMRYNRMLELYAVWNFYVHETAPTDISTLSLHDALPISDRLDRRLRGLRGERALLRELLLCDRCEQHSDERRRDRSEEHTSELQSQSNLVCRLLLEKKKHVYQIPT